MRVSVSSPRDRLPPRAANSCLLQYSAFQFYFVYVGLMFTSAYKYIFCTDSPLGFAYAYLCFAQEPLGTARVLFVSRSLPATYLCAPDAYLPELIQYVSLCCGCVRVVVISCARTNV